MSTVRTQILDAVSRYVDEQISLDTLHSLFVPLSNRIEESDDPNAVELAYLIDGLLAEGSEYWSEQKLRQEFRNAVRPFAASAFLTEAQVTDRLPSPT